MTTVTAVLGEESGIQYQGVQDKSGGMGQAVPSTLITGKFRRGVYGRTMTITTANIRGMLGYDPKNPDYQAVEDALSTGIPSVQVLRLNGESGAAGGSCKPVGWELNDIYNTYSHKQLTVRYQINDEPIVEFLADPVGDSPQYSTFLDTLYAKLDTYIATGGGFGYFQAATNWLSGTEKADVIEGDPLNITFFAVPGQAEDPIKHLLGVDKYTIHSCGAREWAPM